MQSAWLMGSLPQGRYTGTDPDQFSVEIVAGAGGASQRSQA